MKLKNKEIKASAGLPSATVVDRLGTETKRCRAGFALLITAGLLVLAFQTDADRFPAGCGLPGGDGNASDAALAANANIVRVGQVVEYKVSLLNPSTDIFGDPACSVSNAHVTLSLPNGTLIPVLTNIVLNPGDPAIICPGDVRCQTQTTGPAGFGYPYTVDPADVTNIDATSECALTGSTGLLASIDGEALARNSEAGFIGRPYTGCRPLEVNLPRISCTTICTNGIGENGLITFGGNITNYGNSTLVAVTVSNLVDGTLVALTPATNALTPGQSTTFSGSYVQTDPCVPTTNTIFVWAMDFDTGQVVSNTCISTCSSSQVVCPPQLTIIPSGPYMILTWPTNTGGYALQSTANLGSSSAWTTNFLGPVVIGGQNVVIDIVSGTQQFYRLSQ